VRILNEAGIVPEILTTRLSVDMTQIAAKYGRSVQVKCRLLPRVVRLPHDFAVVWFNMVLNLYATEYDLLINSGNSLIFLPGWKNVVTYLHFPHKWRVTAKVLSDHSPGGPAPTWSRRWVKYVLLHWVYHLSRPHPRHTLVCNSEFTRACLKQVYRLPYEPLVIYPPVELARFRCAVLEHRRGVVTVGRFNPDKRQLEQILLAERLPHISFHIIGFVNENDAGYYEHCRAYVKEHGVNNVHLHPNAPLGRMVTLMQSSRYFLHTSINEPFGITTVQAIAAGCLPIVHDSGGQREIVPEPQLRFRSLDELPGILGRLDSLTLNEISLWVHQLQEHVESHFDAAIFRRKMRALLGPYLQELTD